MRAGLVGGQQRELLGAAGAGVGVVDGQDLAVRPVDGQLFPVQGDPADLRVVERDGGAPVQANVVAGPQRPETLAGQRQLADELDEPWVVGVGADRLTEPGDHVGGGPVPVGVQGPFGRVEEHVAQPVPAGRQAG